MLETVLMALVIISINIVVSLLIRQFDRNSISLEKLRKYSEKVKSEFDEFVKNRFKEAVKAISSQIPETIRRYDAEISPAIILIPNHKGSLGIGKSRIQENVEKAVGQNIL